MSDTSKLTKIGVFYDGNYFLHVSNYYLYQHSRKARLSIRGLHSFICSQAAEKEDTRTELCRVVDAHYFRGRLNAFEAREKDKLYPDRVFDDVLMAEGVTTHYLPLRNRGGKKEEKGIDVWMALECYELAMLKQFSVVVLVASDGDFVPLVRKLSALGIRVMLLSWDFEFTDDNGKLISTRTSQDLLEESTFPIGMYDLIENRIKRNDPVLNNLFVAADTGYKYERKTSENGNGTYTNGSEIEPDAEPEESRIFKNKGNFGFIHFPPNNLYFGANDVVEGDIADLQEGDKVSFLLGKNVRGEGVAKEVRRIYEEE